MATTENDSQTAYDAEDLGVACPLVAIDGEPLTVPVRRQPEDALSFTMHIGDGTLPDGTKFTVVSEMPHGDIAVWFEGTDDRRERYLVQMRDVLDAAVRAWEAKLYGQA